MLLQKQNYKESTLKFKNVEITLYNLCLKLKLNKNVIQNIINEHRDHYYHGSLEAINDSLLRNGIPNKAIKIDKSRISELPIPTILYFENKEQFVILEGVSSNVVTILDPIKGEIQFKLEEFLENWDGIALLVSKKIFDIERRNKKKPFNFFLVSTIFSVFLIFFVLFFNNIISKENRTYFSILEFLNLMGVYFSLIIMKVEMYGINNMSLKFCYIGKRFDCYRVALSKISKFFKLFSLADLSFVFFVTISIFYVIAFFNRTEFLNFASFLMILISPIIIVSIIIQMFFIKKWCLFCLMIDAILFIQLIVLFPYLKSLENIHISDIINYTILFVFCMNFLFLIKKFVKLKINLRYFKSSLNFYTCSFGVIKHLIEKEPIIDFTVDNNDIILGYAEPKDTILFIPNPYCKGCKHFFEELLLIMNIFKYRIVIRFLPINKDNSKEIQFIKLLYIQNQLKGYEYVIEILKEVFSYKHDIDKYITNYILKAKYLMNSNNSVDEKYNKNKSWFEYNKIESVPRIIIGNKLFPINLPPKSLYFYLKKVHHQSK